MRPQSLCALSRTLTLSGGVLVVFDEPGQTKVSDLAHQILPDEDVGRTQISVDVVHTFNVGHPRGNLNITYNEHVTVPYIEVG